MATPRRCHPIVDERKSSVLGRFIAVYSSQDLAALIYDFEPEPIEFVLVHDLSAGLLCLIDGLGQVANLDAYGVSSDMIIEVHVKEVAGHRARPVQNTKTSYADARIGNDDRLRTVMIGKLATSLTVSL